MTISLENFKITIASANTDTMNQFANFNVTSVTKKMSISISANAVLTELTTLTQDEILKKLWDRAYMNAAAWFEFVGRDDVDMNALVGTTYVPTTA
jgi:hypothetical protein